MKKGKYKSGVMPRGRVTTRKVMGGYEVCVAGKQFEASADRVGAKMKANRLRKLQGKKAVVKAVRKLIRK